MRSFRSHKSSASLLRRAFHTGLSSMAPAHASYGPNATVFAFGKGREGDATDGRTITSWTGKPVEMHSRIVAMQVKN